MVLRETTFQIGGVLTIALGVLLAAGLGWAGAGADYASAYLGAGLAVAFGTFFLFVGSAETKERRAFLAATDAALEGDGKALGPPPR
jgi:hypothetical protein